MKNIKKSMIFFGAVFVVLLMISSATALTTGHVDKNIRITERNEKMLMDAYNSDDVNIHFKWVIENITRLLETQKVVNSDDIKKIIEDIDDAEPCPWVMSFYFARTIKTDFCPGFKWGLKEAFGFVPFFSFSIGGYISWDAKFDPILGPEAVPINFYIGSDLFSCENHGIAFSFFGMSKWGSIDGAQYGYFNLRGLGSLILVEHPS